MCDALNDGLGDFDLISSQPDSGNGVSEKDDIAKDMDKVMGKGQESCSLKISL